VSSTVQEQPEQNAVASYYAFPVQTYLSRARADIIQDWGDASDSVVSIGCVTYSYSNYLDEMICDLLVRDMVKCQGFL